MGLGWIKLHRKLMEWEWYNDSKTLHLFIHLLINANHSDKKWQGKMIKRGQLITGRDKIKSLTGISEQSIRTCMQRLRDTKEVTIKATNKYSLITIINYDLYQEKENTNQQDNQQPTNNQPTTNQQLTTNKNVKNKKNERDITILNAFKENVLTEAKELNFDKSIYIPFLEHWTERDFESKCYAWQVPETFVIKSRLKGWKRNDNKDKPVTEKNLWT